MNQRAFRRALRYGFGRAILYLRSHDATRYRDDILDGCLHDWDFLPQSMELGYAYMFEVISLTGDRAFYRDHILAAVASASEDRDWDHVLGLAQRFAEAGDEAARDALDHVLERLPFNDRLAWHALEHHGPDGLVRVVQLRLDRLETDGEVRAVYDIVSSWLIEDATERWGKRAVASAIRDAGRADPRIKKLWTDLRQEEAKWRQEDAKGRHDRGNLIDHPPLTYEQVKQILANPNAGNWYRALRTWMETAPDDEWRRLAAELTDLRDDDPRWLRAVDSLYRFRAYPGDPHRLIATVRAARLDRHRYQPDMSGDDRPAESTLSRRAVSAMNALAHMSHPAVRSFALELLETSTWTSAAASLLEQNYVDGDLEMLAAVFRRERSEKQRHGIGYFILAIDQELAPAEAPPVLLLVYEHVRCGECRADLVERLHAHAALPAAIADECCFDSHFGIRERIAELVPGACTGSGD